MVGSAHGWTHCATPTMPEFRSSRFSPGSRWASLLAECRLDSPLAGPLVSRGGGPARAPSGTPGSEIVMARLFTELTAADGMCGRRGCRRPRTALSRTRSSSASAGPGQRDSPGHKPVADPPGVNGAAGRCDPADRRVRPDSTGDDHDQEAPGARCPGRKLRPGRPADSVRSSARGAEPAGGRNRAKGTDQ